jgi:polar amino acid transport system substrate-binding protein
LTPGTGNVAIAPGAERPQGIGADLGAALGMRLGMAVEWVTYPNSGALTEAGTTGAWDVAFMPVDEQRKQKLDFGAAHIVLESTWLVGPGSSILMLADVDRPGTRVVGVENTASARAAQRHLKNLKAGLVKSTDEGFELLRTGKVDVTGGSRESLVVLAVLLPGSRVLDGARIGLELCQSIERGDVAESIAMPRPCRNSEGSLSAKMCENHNRPPSIIPASPASFV